MPDPKPIPVDPRKPQNRQEPIDPPMEEQLPVEESETEEED